MPRDNCAVVVGLIEYQTTLGWETSVSEFHPLNAHICGVLHSSDAVPSKSSPHRLTSLHFTLITILLHMEYQPGAAWSVPRSRLTHSAISRTSVSTVRSTLLTTTPSILSSIDERLDSASRFGELFHSWTRIYTPHWGFWRFEVQSLVLLLTRRPFKRATDRSNYHGATQKMWLSSSRPSFSINKSPYQYLSDCISDTERQSISVFRSTRVEKGTPVSHFPFLLMLPHMSVFFLVGLYLTAHARNRHLLMGMKFWFVNRIIDHFFRYEFRTWDTDYDISACICLFFCTKIDENIC